MTHQAALRALAFKWILILYRCWADCTPLLKLAAEQASLYVDFPCGLPQGVSWAAGVEKVASRVTLATQDQLAC
jgi:hypothetical protein